MDVTLLMASWMVGLAGFLDPPPPPPPPLLVPKIRCMFLGRGCCDAAAWFLDLSLYSKSWGKNNRRRKKKNREKRSQSKNGNPSRTLHLR